jgi:hypothetical protein
VVLSGKSPDRTRWNENLAPNAAHGETPRCDEVIDRTNAEAERFNGIAARIEQLFYTWVHVNSHWLAGTGNARE